MKPARKLTQRLTLPMMTLAILMSGCANTAPSGTESACDAMRPHLPTYSSRDTEETKRLGAKFLDVFAAVCPD